MAATRSPMFVTEMVVRETMAKTRSQAVVTEETIGSRIQALEDLVKERNQKIDRNILDMLEAMNLLTNKGYSSHVQDLRNSSRVSPAPANSPSDPAHGHRSGISNSYVRVTRLAKLDCPRFGGDRVKEWLFKIEQFFLVDRTPDELKIGLVSGLFDDLAATWHQWLVQSVLWKHVMHDWMTYKMLLQGRFKELEVDPIVELKQLQETDGIRDYHEKFELIKSRVNLSEAYLVSIYLAGLRTDTQVNVKMFQPQTVSQCFMLGRLYEQAHPRSNTDTRGISEPKAAKDTKVVEIEVETKSIETMAHEAILKEDLIPQFQVPVSNLESSLRFHNASPVVCEDSHSVVVGCTDLFNHQETILQALYTTKARDVSLQKSTSVPNSQVAHQLFEKMPLREQSKKRHIKCFKCWRFKFKLRKQQRGKPRIAHKLIYRGGVMYKYFASSVKVVVIKKKNKFCKTWSTLKDGCFKKTRPQIEDVMGEDRKKQHGDSEHDTKVFETLKDLQQFTLGEVMFQIKHKWRDDQFSVEKTIKIGRNFHYKNRLIQGELVKMGELSKLRLKKHHMSQYLWKSWCSTVLYGYFLWEHSDNGTQLLCSRRLVVYKLGSEAKNAVAVSQRVYWTVALDFAKVEPKLEVTQSQTFDPGIGLESQETLRRTMEVTAWEFSLFRIDNFQTLNLVVKVL